MGISGSGCSGAAYLARYEGFQVSGCDLNPNTSSTDQLRKLKIPIHGGHNISHLRKADLLVTSPAVLIVNSRHPEIREAKRRGIILTWQQFIGRYLQKDKYLVCIAGTHGKTTTSALVGQILEAGKLDPTVLVGGVVPVWQANVRCGESNYFICEADEYYNNFLNYSPKMAVITNIEMDHPEFFSNLDQLRKSFTRFIFRLDQPKILIVNSDDDNIRQILVKNQLRLNRERVQITAFHLDSAFDFPFAKDFRGIINRQEKFSTRFSIVFDHGKKTIKEDFQLRIPGRHNVYNALAAYACGWFLNINSETLKTVFNSFSGVKRRFEIVGKEARRIVIDDYGHHPTQIAATIEAVKQRYPKSFIWAVLEPHQTRFRFFTNEFVTALKKANQVIVTEIFWGREKITSGLSAQELAAKIGLPKASCIEDFKKVADFIAKNSRSEDVVIVFGAGNSSQLAKMIVRQLKKLAK